MPVSSDAQLARSEAAQRRRVSASADATSSGRAPARRSRASPSCTIAAVGEHEQAVGERGGVRVVGDHHDRLAELVDRVAQQLEHLAGGLRVEVARSARRRTRRRAARSARARPRRAAAGRRTARAGRWLRRSRMPTVSISRSNHSRSGSRPAIESGSRMFSRASSIGSRLKVWKMKPILSRRSCVSASVVERAQLDAVERDRRPRSAGPGRRAGASASTCPSPTGP